MHSIPNLLVNFIFKLFRFAKTMGYVPRALKFRNPVKQSKAAFPLNTAVLYVNMECIVFNPKTTVFCSKQGYSTEVNEL